MASIRQNRMAIMINREEDQEDLRLRMRQMRIQDEYWHLNQLFVTYQIGIRTPSLWLSNKDKLDKHMIRRKLKRIEDKWVKQIRQVDGIKWSLHTREWHTSLVKECVAGQGCGIKLFVYINSPLWKEYRPTFDWNPNWPYANAWLSHKYMWDLDDSIAILNRNRPMKGWPPGWLGVVIKAYCCKEEKYDWTPMEIIRGEVDPWDYCGDCWLFITIRNTAPGSLQRMCMLKLGRPLLNWKCNSQCTFLDWRRTPLDALVIQDCLPQFWRVAMDLTMSF
uniref:Vif protein n=1 Tax=Feline immunodeficiency virus TaxID=11673 RepID=A0A059UII1_9RETR|nr:vif protein [Feline immunodeficiency virus]